MSTVSYDLPPQPQPRPEQRRSGDPHDPDPSEEIPSLAPNMGQEALPHVVTFQGLLRNVARCYQASDEAIRDSWDNARFMRNDPGIMECLEQRKRSTALLGWHLECDDEKDSTQKQLVEELTSIIKQTPNFLKYRECLLEALWYGKYACAHRYRWKAVRGQMRLVVDKWRPVNGDKLVFRYDDGSGEYDDDQVGIRVGQGFTEGSQVAKRWEVRRINKVAATDQGLAYFLEHWERPLLAIHKHTIEDGAFEAPELAGSIHGVGIRSRIYWMWYQKQETLAWLMEYLERSAFGIEIWSYPAGNVEAKAATMKAAQERVGNGRNIVFVPRHPDSEVLSSDVKRIEPGMAGADILDRILREYFGWQIKRYILGQILTSETASTGLGSGVATIHLDTYLQIVRYDATNLQETLTTDLVRPLQTYNFPELADIPIRFVIETEAPDVEGKLRGWKSAYEMGLKIRAQDVADLIGAAVAKPGEETLQDPQHVQAAAQQQQMAMQQQQAAQQQAAAQAERDADYAKVLSHFFGPNQVEQYRRVRRGVVRYVYGRDGSLKRIERYRAVPDKKDQGPGWRTVGGGAHVHIDDSGKIDIGYPGLETEDVDEIGTDEEPENRRRREHRKEVAEHHGLKGEDLTPAQTKALEKQPHPETGKTADGQQAASPEPTRDRPVTVQINGKPFEVSKIYGIWFFRQPGANDWTVASSPMVQVIQQHGQAKPAAQPQEQIPGGRAAGKPDTAFDPQALAKGQQVEMEHTTDPATAAEIAKDHLAEDPRYYDKLERIEQPAEDEVPFDIPPADEPVRATINPRSKVGRAILATAQDWGLPPDDLADAVEYVWEQHAAEGGRDRQKALEAARKLTGLRPADVKRLKNSGYDHTSAKRVGGQVGQRLAHFDEFAQEIAREYPVLGLGNPDDPSADFAARLWEVLDEDRATLAPMDDPDLLREAAQMVLANQQAAASQPIYASHEEFRRHGEVVKYRKWLVERYAKAAPGQKSFDWDEKAHPRNADGEFAKKGEGQASHAGKSEDKSQAKPAAPTAEEEAKYADYLKLMGQYKLHPASQEDWLSNYRTVQARIRQQEQAAKEPEEPAQQAEAKSEEPAQGFAQDDEAEPEDETPRDRADRQHEKRLDDDYAYARASAVRNAGEDLLGSARHKANAWRGLEQAEKDGTAAEMVTRDQLLKNEPVDLLAKIHPANAMTALGMHLAMRAFPADPGLKWSRGRGEDRKKKDREDYLDVYRDLKRIAEDHVEDNVSLWESLDQFNNQVRQHIERLRKNDRSNPVANALIALYKATRRVNYGRPSTRSVQGQMGEFAGRLKQAYGDADQQTLDKAAEHVKDLIEGKSLNKTFGTVQAGGGKKRSFDPAEMYVKHATRVGGADLGLRTPDEATGYMVDQLRLRGVQFGNYVTDSERAHHATKCAEALTDLASVLGIPGEYVSWKGKLGVAIGARGTSQALAHYEPGNQVINLTRKDGVGSLAHEWGHFFDHVLAGGRIVRKGDAKRSSGDYFSEWTASKRIELDEHGSVVLEEKNGRKQVKSTDLSTDPLWSAFDGLRKAWKSSGFGERLSRVTWAKVKDGSMSKAKREYWTSGRETFARCFERYIQRKLETSGRQNTYLAGISPMAYSADGFWPDDAEVDAMTPAFDKVFEELGKGIEKGRYWLREIGDRLILERRGDLAERFAKEFEARGFVLRNSQSGETLADRQEAVEKAAAETERNPSEDQKAAGNYKKGKCRLFGLEIAIETPKGATRSGKDQNGNAWSIEMPYHYGYIKRTESEADGDHIDVFIGPHLDSELVFVVDQVRPDSGRFDEHKCMIGWTSAQEAKEAYHACYSDGWQGFEAITPMTMPQFKEWLENGDSGHRIAQQV
jgi:hypothetical protein